MAKNGIKIDELHVTPKEATLAIAQCFAMKRPVMIVGQPGAGKSALLADLGEKMARPIVDMRLSQFDAADIRGIPHLSEKTTIRRVEANQLDVELELNPEAEVVTLEDGSPKLDDGHVSIKQLQRAMEWALPELFPKDPESRTIIFLDELNAAPPIVQSAAYQLVLDRKLGDYTLPEGVRVVAAGNRNKDRGATFDMAFPLRNRFVHLTMVVSFEDWQEWAVLQGNVHPEIISFLSAKPSLLNEFEQALKSNAYAFATPRTWEYASDLIWSYTNNGNKLTTTEFQGISDLDDVMSKTTLTGERRVITGISIVEKLLAGCIGVGPATEFMRHWEFISKLPSVTEVLNDKFDKQYDFSGLGELSSQYSLVYGCVNRLLEIYGEAATNAKDKAKPYLEAQKAVEVHFNNFYKFMDKHCKPELLFFGVSSLYRKGRNRYKDAPATHRIVSIQNEYFDKFVDEFSQDMEIM